MSSFEIHDQYLKIIEKSHNDLIDVSALTQIGLAKLMQVMKLFETVDWSDQVTCCFNILAFFNHDWLCDEIKWIKGYRIALFNNHFILDIFNENTTITHIQRFDSVYERYYLVNELFCNVGYEIDIWKYRKENWELIKGLKDDLAQNDFLIDINEVNTNKMLTIFKFI